MAPIETAIFATVLLGMVGAFVYFGTVLGHLQP